MGGAVRKAGNGTSNTVVGVFAEISCQTVPLSHRSVSAVSASESLAAPDFINFPWKIPAGANLTGGGGGGGASRGPRLQVTRRFSAVEVGSISYQRPVENLTLPFLSEPPDR